MRLVITAILCLSAQSVFAAEAETCPEGQSREVTQQLIHDAVLEFEPVEIQVPVQEGLEVVTIPAQYKWIYKTDTYDHPAQLTYEYKDFVKATYKAAEFQTYSDVHYQNILLKLDGSYEAVDYDKATEQREKTYDYVVVQPKYYVTHTKTIPMPPPIEENGKLKVLVQPAITFERDIPQVMKVQTVQRVTSRKPAILREVLGECR